MDKFQWFKSAKFGMMVHWGLYSIPAGEWKGQRMPYIGEWLQARFRIPNAEYHQLATIFNPIFFNADEWVKLARDAGMKYIVATSKHHEGFAMYRSKVDSFNIVDATPFKRDVIGELADACARHNMKLGLYYSQELDWADPDGGGYTRTTPNAGMMSWTNDWDYPDTSQKNYDRCFERKIKPQVKEILTQYGDLCLIWFDTPDTISPAQSKELAEMLQKTITGYLQPDNTREIKQATKDIYILYQATKPAVMVECGFLSNREEAARLTDEEYQDQIAFSICMALMNCLADRS